MLPRSQPCGDLSLISSLQQPEDQPSDFLSLPRSSSEAPSAASSYTHLNSSLHLPASSGHPSGAHSLKSMTDVHQSDSASDVVTTCHLMQTQKTINRWVKLMDLPSGSRSLRVWLCQNLQWDGKSPDQYCAMKCMRREDSMSRYALLKKSAVLSGQSSSKWREQQMTDTDVLRDEAGDAVRNNDESWKREIAILKRCRHPHVVRLLEVIDDQSSKKVYMALEFMAGGGTIWTDGQGNPTFDRDKARWTLRDVASGLMYLHTQGIVHRDVKPSNLLWNEQHNYVKISDFGESVYSEALKNETGDRRLLDIPILHKTAGSPAFYAPEACMIPNLSPYEEAEDLNDGTAGEDGGMGLDQVEDPELPVVSRRIKARSLPLNAQVDVWALGITLYCLLFGKTPWPDATIFQIPTIITQQSIALPKTMGVDKKKVVGAEGDEATEAEEFIDLIGKLLNKDPRARISLQDVAAHPWALRNHPQPQEWLSDTKDKASKRLEVTFEDLESAILPTETSEIALSTQQIEKLNAGFAERFKTNLKKFFWKDDHNSNGGGGKKTKSASRKASGILGLTSRSRAGSLSGSTILSNATSSTGSMDQQHQEEVVKKKISIGKRFGRSNTASDATTEPDQVLRRSISIRSVGTGSGSVNGSGSGNHPDESNPQRSHLRLPIQALRRRGSDSQSQNNPKPASPSTPNFRDYASEYASSSTNMATMMTRAKSQGANVQHQYQQQNGKPVALSTSVESTSSISASSASYFPPMPPPVSSSPTISETKKFGRFGRWRQGSKSTQNPNQSQTQVDASRRASVHMDDDDDLLKGVSRPLSPSSTSSNAYQFSSNEEEDDLDVPSSEMSGSLYEHDEHLGDIIAKHDGEHSLTDFEFEDPGHLRSDVNKNNLHVSGSDETPRLINDSSSSESNLRHHHNCHEAFDQMSTISVPHSDGGFTNDQSSVVRGMTLVPQQQQQQQEVDDDPADGEDEDEEFEIRIKPRRRSDAAPSCL